MNMNDKNWLIFIFLKAYSYFDGKVVPDTKKKTIREYNFMFLLTIFRRSSMFIFYI